jgi:hypothetical protein
MPRLKTPSPAMAVALLALFCSLSGTVVAASALLPKNSVTTTQIKNGSIRGIDIAPGSLTGAQINSTTLGLVPRADHAATSTTAQSAIAAQSAASAQNAQSAVTAQSAQSAQSAVTAATATNAQALGGHAAGDFVTGDTVRSIGLRFTGSQTRTLADVSGLHITATCSVNVARNGSQKDELSISASSSTDGATMSSSTNWLNGSTSALTLGPSTSAANEVASVASTGTGQKLATTTPGFVVVASDGTSVFLGGLYSGIQVAFNLYGGPCTVTTPIVITHLS